MRSRVLFSSLQDCTNPGIVPTYLDHHSTLTRCGNVGGMYLQYLLLYILTIKLDSRVWHQTLRKNLTSHANFLANTLHLPRGTFTTYFKLFTTFLISGLLHAIGEHVFFQNFPEGATVQFFLLQAVGITFEDAVIGIASRLGYKESNAFKLIGFMWVFAWFTFCMPMWVNSQVHSRKVHYEDFSLVQVLRSFCSSHGIFTIAT